jgi:hypothetical protein
MLMYVEVEIEQIESGKREEEIEEEGREELV